jgi:methyl-accepting chemotaxis protein
MQSLQNEEIEATIKTADELWAAYREKRKDAEWAKKEVTAKISYFQDKGFSNFITKYAVPTRYMVMYDEYSHHAFQKYLVRLKTVGYKSKDDWVERQADYVKFLWRAYNPRGSAKEAADARHAAYESIKKEMDGFENDYDKAKVKAEERRRTALSDNRQALLDMLADTETRTKILSVQTRTEEAAKAAEEAAKAAEEAAKAAEEAAKAAEEVAEATATADEDATEPAEPVVLTATQRKNAARRRAAKVKKALAAVPVVPQKTVEQVWLAERAADKEKQRVERRKERARAKVLEREAEKDRMRRKWEETRAKMTGEEPLPQLDEVVTDDDIDDLPDDI